MPLTKYILYACPTGCLATRLSIYFDRAKSCCGPNPAHNYMPHISLTGFFHDEAAVADWYVSYLDTRMRRLEATRPSPVVVIPGMRFDDDFLGLDVESPWLKQITAAFADMAESSTRTEPIRCKRWLHLSLAYGFPAAQRGALVSLAKNWVDIEASVGWALRFYERDTEMEWTLHGDWPLG